MKKQKIEYEKNISTKDYYTNMIVENNKKIKIIHKKMDNAASPEEFIKLQKELSNLLYKNELAESRLNSRYRGITEYTTPLNM